MLGWLGADNGAEKGGTVCAGGSERGGHEPPDVPNCCSFRASSDRLLFEVILQERKRIC